jgi:hypothetical protein
LEAALETVGGPRFQHSIAAPRQLQIQQVSLLENESERLARWSRASDGTITLFLKGPTSGKQALSLRGSLPAPIQGTLPLGAVAVKADEIKSSRVHLYRQPAVRIDVSKAAGLTDTGRPTGDEDKPGLGRWTSSFQVQGPVPADAVLKLAPNRPQVRAKQVIALRREGEAWRGEVLLQLQVRDGLADEIRLEVPGSWIGPFAADPPASLRVLDLPDRARRTLVLYPRAAIEGESRLAVSSPVAPPTERMGVGPITLEGVDTAETMLVLPAQTEAGPLQWETQGLAPASLPAEYALVPGARGSLAAYRVVTQPFQASLKPAQPPRGNPQIVLADVSIAWQADGTWHGVAAFDLDPAGLETCTIRLAPECRLIQITAGEVPAVSTAVDDHAWQISLGTSPLPQRIEVLFAGMDADPAAAEERHFHAPEVLTVGQPPCPLPVLQSLWTLRGPRRFEAELGGDVPPAEPLDQELARLLAITELIQRAVDSPAHDPEATARWYRVWARRCVASRNRLKRLVAAADGTEAAETSRAQLEAIWRRQVQLAEHLGVPEISAPTPGETPPEDPVSLWRWSMDRSQPAIRCVAGRVSDPARAGVDRSSQAISLLCRPSRRDWLWGRILGAAAIVVGTIVLWFGTRGRRLTRAVRRHWHLAGVAVGLGWWLVLRPSVLGLVVVAVSLAAAISHQLSAISRKTA